MRFRISKASKIWAGLALGMALTQAVSASTVGTISSADGNSGVDDIYSSDPLEGLYGANWQLTGCSPGGCEVTIEYLGKEAGYTNTFEYNGAEIFSTSGRPNNSFSDASPPSNTIGGQSNGLMNFAFTTSGGGTPASVTNGSNPDDGGGAAGGVNFFSYMETGTSLYEGTVLDLWFDDEGANNDDNHDDIAIRLSVIGGTISEVPLPAAAWLFGSAILGLTVVARRRPTTA